MTVLEFLELIDSIEYKPGAEVRVMNRPDERYPYDGYLHIALCRTVPDSKKPGHTIDIQHNLTLSENDIDAFDLKWAKHIIYDHLCKAEIHELEEFLKFGGVQYRDPHANGG